MPRSRFRWTIPGESGPADPGGDLRSSKANAREGVASHTIYRFDVVTLLSCPLRYGTCGTLRRPVHRVRSEVGVTPERCGWSVRQHGASRVRLTVPQHRCRPRADRESQSCPHGRFTSVSRRNRPVHSCSVPLRHPGVTEAPVGRERRCRMLPRTTWFRASRAPCRGAGDSREEHS